MLSNDFSSKYPHLFQETTWPWGPTRARFVLLDSAPPGDRISNVNIVPRLHNNWVTIRLRNGSWEIPGGTLEPGESYIDTIRRELWEEAGAQLITFQIIGAWHCFSLADKPYRPYLPFPEYYRLVGLGDIEMIRVPQNPVDGEEVVIVEAASLETAIARFVSSHRYDLAELYQLASDLGH